MLWDTAGVKATDRALELRRPPGGAYGPEWPMASGGNQRLRILSNSAPVTVWGDIGVPGRRELVAHVSHRAIVAFTDRPDANVRRRGRRSR